MAVAWYEAVRAEGAKRATRSIFIGLIETIQCFQGNARIFFVRKGFSGPLFSSKSLVEFSEIWWL